MRLPKPKGEGGVPLRYQLDIVNMLKFATTENSYRYRPIIRFLYELFLSILN